MSVRLVVVLLVSWPLFAPQVAVSVARGGPDKNERAVQISCMNRYFLDSYSLYYSSGYEMVLELVLVAFQITNRR